MPSQAEITIRDAVSGDAEAISVVLCASISELCSADHRGDPDAIAQWVGNKTPDHIRAWIGKNDLKLIVAVHDNAIAGVGAVSDDGTIKLNYVSPAQRFCGVSTEILAQLEEMIIAMGFAEGRLISSRTALHFYRARGWCDDGPPDPDHAVDGYPMRKVLIKKRPRR